LDAAVSESFLLIERHEEAGGMDEWNLCAENKARKRSLKARTNETTELWCDDFDFG
jgi:hypothetical protein